MAAQPAPVNCTPCGICGFRTCPGHSFLKSVEFCRVCDEPGTTAAPLTYTPAGAVHAHCSH